MGMKAWQCVNEKGQEVWGKQFCWVDRRVRAEVGAEEPGDTGGARVRLPGPLRGQHLL